MKYKLLSLLLIVAQIPLIGATPILNAQVPESAFIDGIEGRPQTYPLSCESRSAADVAWFWGVGIDELTFLNSLPTSDNPNKGFVGTVLSTWGQLPPNPYGVHAPPIANHLRNWGLDAHAHQNMSFEELQEEIAAGRPVIVWVISAMWAGESVTYVDLEGDTAQVAAFEHTNIIIGYDANNVYTIDALDGETKIRSISAFKESWGVLGNMAVTVNGLIGENEDANSGKPNLTKFKLIQLKENHQKFVSVNQKH